MKFKTIDDYIDSQNEKHIEIFVRVIEFINKEFPNLEEKISYGVPFYYHQGALFYLSPYKEGMYIGFARGYLIPDYQDKLISENRKQIKIFKIKFEDQIDKNLLKQIIQQAIKINETMKNEKI